LVALGLVGKTFLAVLLNPPWESLETATLFRILRNLLVPQLLPSGMVFLWSPKSLLSEIFAFMEEMGFQYIENLVWCRMDVNNRLNMAKSEFFQGSKSVLLIFRRFQKKENLELRHQRNADVVLDFVPPHSSWSTEGCLSCFLSCFALL
jgi:hypothetical protein